MDHKCVAACVLGRGMKSYDCIKQMMEDGFEMLSEPLEAAGAKKNLS